MGWHTAGQHCACAAPLRCSSLRLQNGAGSQGGAEPGTERSLLGAVPDFSAAPLDRQRQQPQPGRREPEADSDARSGPSQVSFRLRSPPWAKVQNAKCRCGRPTSLEGSCCAYLHARLLQHPCCWGAHLCRWAAINSLVPDRQVMDLQSNVAILLVAVCPVVFPCPTTVQLPMLLTALICMEQALLGAGAIILAAIFAVTSFGGDGPSSSKRAPPSQQVAFWP